MSSRKANPSSGVWRVGADTGGTFTDIVARRGDEVRTHKLPSTPHDPAAAILAGIAAILGEPDSRDPFELVHGSTVATNTILQRQGARVGLITTQGFADIIEIGRQNRPALYSLEVRKAEALVPRRRRLEVAERVRADGQIERAVSRATLRKALRAWRGKVDSVAVGFLFSYLNADNETVAGEVAREVLGDDVPITLSSVVSPEAREYERLSTAVLNAFVAPRMVRYLDNLERDLGARSIEIMGSGGGTVALDRSRREPVGTFLSGPAAGVLGAQQIAARAGFERIITFDMGGTSTDVSLVDETVSLRNESTIAGLPLRYPILDIHTVGAGGGSLARVDAGGSLRVGPQSAGADPGPAVYGVGKGFTVTDAHVVLGHLAADSFLSGAMEIFPERAAGPLEKLARQAGLSSDRTALGVLEVVNAEMERAIRVVSQERGRDPRSFALVAFGGASGLHAASMARDLEIPQILIPRDPGLLCATGMLDAERVRWRSRTLQELEDVATPRRLRRTIDALLREARRDFPRVPRTQLQAHVELDLRFEGQTHVLTLPYSLEVFTGADSNAYTAAFRERCAERFGLVDASWPVEVVTVRVALRHRTAVAESSGRDHAARRKPRRRRAPAPRSHRRMAIDRPRREEVPVHARDDLKPGHRLRGPLLVSEYSGTVLCPEDFTLEVDRDGNILLRRSS